MAWAKPTHLTYWSYSRYSTYKQCPLRAKLMYLDKLPTTKNEAMDRGNEIHKLAEQFVKGEIKKIPPELASFSDDFKAVKDLKKKKPHLVSVEDTWAFRSDWSRTTWDDWQGCWVRIKLDQSHIETEPDGSPALIITDVKTGKFSPQWNLDDYLEQLDLYALGGLLVWQQLIKDGLKVKPRLLYTDQKVVYPPKDEPKVYTGADLVPLKNRWEKRVKPMLTDRKFPPKPNNMCKWCDFSKEKGGPCKF